MALKNVNRLNARVLVVDDDASFIRRATVSLGSLARVESVTSGEDLLRRVYVWLPDIILLNPLLADSDGFHLLEELLDLDLDRPPFVFCTTSGPASTTRLSTCPGWPVGTISRSARLELLRDTVEWALAAREDEGAETDVRSLIAGGVTG